MSPEGPTEAMHGVDLGHSEVQRLQTGGDRAHGEAGECQAALAPQVIFQIWEQEERGP